MLISFIIPIYNAEKLIEKCVLSIINQNIDPKLYEILLIDDGSTDNTKANCKALKLGFNNVHFFTKSNAGPGHSRNFGLNKSKGEYIWFLDADDRLKENVLTKIITYLNEKRDLYIVGYEEVNLNLETIGVQKFKNNVLSPNKLLEKRIYINTVWSKLIKKTILINNQIFFKEDVRGPEDFHFSVRLLVYVKSIKTIDLICYSYLENPTGLMNSKSKIHWNSLANDSLKVLKDLKLIIKSLNDIELKKGIDLWLINFTYGLLLSFIRYKYTSKFVADSLSQLSDLGYYPVKLLSDNKKGNLFLKIANNRLLFVSIIRFKNIFGI